MPRVVLSVVLAATLAMSALPLQAQDAVPPKILGLGSFPCSVYLYGVDKPEELQGWIMGYLSGRNFETWRDGENFDTPVFDMVLLRSQIRAFCAERPLGRIVDAVNTMFPLVRAKDKS